IGEAMGRLLNFDPDLSISDARRIVDARNRIIHGYDTVSDAIIWSIARNDLPGLKAEVIELLGSDK
ncbi:MAG: HepT-like ribonuclease domain-containing protein, partial [Flavobacteriales bacterium]